MSAVAPVAAQAGARRVPQPLLLGGATAGALAIALLAIGHVAETRTSPLVPVDDWRVVLVAGAAGAFAAYVLALLSLRGRAVALVPVLAVAAAIQCAPLASPLLLSRDVYMYWDYGRTAAVHGGNPYTEFPVRWPADPAYRHASTAWARELSPYGPGWTVVDEAAAKVAGTSARTASLVFRILAATAMLATVGLVAWSTRSAFSVALVGWNPVLALHFAGGGHADAAMMALVAAGLALAARRPLAAGGAWVAAVSVKVAALPFLVLEAVHRLREQSLRWALGVAATGTVGLAISLGLFGPSLVRSGGPISNQLRDANAIGLPTRLHQLGLPLHAAQVTAALGFVLLYLWLVREAWHGRRRLSLAAVGLCLGVAWLMPWYAAWPLVLAAFDLDVAGIVLAVALSGYVLLDALPT